HNSHHHNQRTKLNTHKNTESSVDLNQILVSRTTFTLQLDVHKVEAETPSVDRRFSQPILQILNGYPLDLLVS
ncbi:unnamed protein product, partial [Plutella xylostella]